MDLDSAQPQKTASASDSRLSVRKNTIDWIGSAPFIALHLGCMLVFIAGWSPTALLTACITYAVRGFCITAGYHRYFSHRSFKTSRLFQFLMALFGTMAIQMGPLWWASHHRNHHRYSDQARDMHSPVSSSFLWSHIGWIMSSSSYRNVDTSLVGDLVKYPELRWLDKWCLIPPVLLGVCLWITGEVLRHSAPHLATDGLQLLTWGFFISTVALHHVTFSINSIAHVFGSRRFSTGDQSRNNPALALISMGEGWHNNHHRFPGSARQGIYWWEIDITHYILKILSFAGIVHSVKVTSRQSVNKALSAERFASAEK